MTHNDIVRMACGAGMIYDPINKEFRDVDVNSIEELTLAEREACAKVCEQDEFQIYETAERCAAAIRARGEQ